MGALPIPSLAGHPLAFRTGILPDGLVRLGRTMAEADMFTSSDLRTGRAGPRRMIEKAWQRWFEEAGQGLEHMAVPMHFSISAEPGKPLDGSIAWLEIGYGRMTRWYTSHADEIAKENPDLAEHALAVLYAGLDTICYAPKAPDFLALAKAYWWRGADNEKAIVAEMKAAEKRRAEIRAETGGAGTIYEVMVVGDPGHGRRARTRLPSRRKFDHRYPLLHQAPKRHPAAMQGTSKFKGLREAIAEVESAMRSPHVLRRNGAEIYGTPHCGHFPIIVRARYGDFLGRLLDDHWHAMRDAKLKSFNHHSAWPLGTVEQIERVRRGLTPTLRLAAALTELIQHLGHVASNQRML